MGNASTMYSYEEAFKESLEYFSGDELAAEVFLTKYALRDREGNLLEKTPDDMHWRLAREFARIEKKKFRDPLTAEEIFKYLSHFKYIVPQGSPMYGIGNNYTYQSLGNCFILGMVPDSYGGIMFYDEMIVQLCKRRCGVGLRLDKVRPRGAPVSNAAHTSDGMRVFMERFSNSIREVAQSGRRGAGILTISVHHPDVFSFINAKTDMKSCTGANISVMLTDEFMSAVEKDEEYELRWPVDSECPSISKMVRARKVWDNIIENAWKYAEPGLIFEDNMIRGSMSDCYKKINEDLADVCTNPCAEIPAPAYESCRLLCVNVLSFVKNPFTKDAKFDSKLFRKVVRIAQRLMDDMVDLEIEKMDRIIKKVKSDPEPNYIKHNELWIWKKFRETAEMGRRTGLGVTAVGDALAAMNIKYGSPESVKAVEEIYRVLAIESMRSSCEMAQELGPFPLYTPSVEEDVEIINRILDQDKKLKEMHKKYGRRNISLTTTAPTGSVSILTQTTSGIEPVYLLEYDRRRKVNDGEEYDFENEVGDKFKTFTVRHRGLQLWMDITGNKNIKKSPYWKATSEDIDWETSVDIQAVAQKWVSHSISKTCNLPHDVDKSVVEKVYMRAYKSGCKGFTVYRQGSREGILLSKDSLPVKIVKSNAPKRPRELPCDVHYMSVNGCPYFVMVGLLDGQPYEVFAGRSTGIDSKCKSGKIIKSKRPKIYKAILDDGIEICPLTIGCTHDEEVITRLTSMSLRHGAGIQFIVDQLLKVEGNMTTFAKAIARALKKYIKNGEKSTTTCKKCGMKSIVFLEGCQTCQNCGDSKCM